MKDIFGVEGKVLLVTGGASGIGAAAVKIAAASGAKVCVADVDLQAAEELARQVDPEGRNILSCQVDVSDDRSVTAMMAALVERFGRLDGAFNNAGIGLGAVESAGRKAAEVREEAWRRMLDVNLTGVWLCMKAELRTMRSGAAIVNASSIAGLSAMPMSAPYVAAKHGVVGLTKAAAIDYGPAGIRINAICPGYTDTPLIGHVGKERRSDLAARKPLGRFGQPDEIARQAIWLLSDNSSYVTGAAFTVDGGYSAT
ncbi:NAD(P)-dependent dehydrogenase (short-subunit alcohol dehydrogenase family) [Chelatococcus asaccharovorans]|uniref:NAD(P)-dependent dehydrogenase (Short-subunit alcohol dehydrogenase family) n=2 Tax=Chelatococcus asaccharovorans TaxID=28210 RepID=A0A2V3TR63_9HYPH|nr:NAD(P)-dependent dehydrogenase (short-subunit alcohol dehydrogenase family) [Chelatococcus asaccharovorans]